MLISLAAFAVALVAAYLLTPVVRDAAHGAGLHPSLGPVTMRQLLATWVVHDHNHLAQAHGALAAHYADEVGPWRALLGILDQVEP
ncbi:MAG TPA: hypothetical protein VF013_06660 [Candidatus Limnocylindria bacterium]